jgi:glycine betaine/proline transport system substrate-binding protein
LGKGVPICARADRRHQRDVAEAIKARAGSVIAGYHFENGTEDHCIGRFVWAVDCHGVPAAGGPQGGPQRDRQCNGASLKASEGLLDEAVLTDLTQLCPGNPMMEILDENVRRRKSTEYTDHSPLN